MNADPRGVLRGRCTACSCDGYSRASGGVKCDDCGHPPAKHGKLSASDAGPSQTAYQPTPPPAPRPTPRPVSAVSTPPIPPPRKARVASAKPLPSFSGPRCLFPNCTNEAFFDPNSGDESQYCSDHFNAEFLDTENSLPAVLSSVMYVTDGSSDFAMSLPPHGTVQGQPGASQATLWQPMVSQTFLTYVAAIHSYLKIIPKHAHRCHQLPMFQPPAAVQQPMTAQPPATVQSPLPTAQPQPRMLLILLCTVYTGIVHSISPSQCSTAPLLPDHLRCKYPHCNRKRFQESNGKTHEFCGRTHALEYNRLAQKGCKKPILHMSLYSLSACAHEVVYRSKVVLFVLFLHSSCVS